MDSRRQKKIASLIQETLSEILQREGAGYYGNQVLVTVTQVKVTPDLSICRLYISVFNAKEPDLVVEALRHHRHDLRGKMGNKLRNHLRKIPELEIFRDETLDEVFRLEQLFKDLHNSEQGGNASGEEEK